MNSRLGFERMVVFDRIAGLQAGMSSMTKRRRNALVYSWYVDSAKEIPDCCTSCMMVLFSTTPELLRATLASKANTRCGVFFEPVTFERSLSASAVMYSWPIKRAFCSPLPIDAGHPPLQRAKAISSTVNGESSTCCRWAFSNNADNDMAPLDSLDSKRLIGYMVNRLIRPEPECLISFFGGTAEPVKIYIPFLL